MPNKWSSAGAESWSEDYPLGLVNPWFRYFYKCTVTEWNFTSLDTTKYATEYIRLVGYASTRPNTPNPFPFVTYSGSSQGQYGDPPEYYTNYYGARCDWEYIGWMNLTAALEEIGKESATIDSYACGTGYLTWMVDDSYNMYEISGVPSLTSPSPAPHLVLIGQLHFIDSRGCALAPILESPESPSVASAAYVIYDANENQLATGSLSLNGGMEFAIHLNPDLESSIDTIKFSFTLDESDRTFNSYAYKVNSVKINNTPTVKLNGTYDYSMQIPSTHSLGTIEIQRRYIVK